MAGKSIIPIFNLTSGNFGSLLGKLRASAPSPARVQAQVRSIIDKVADQGDTALIKFTKQFDGVSLSSNQIRVKASETKAAYRVVSKKQLQALHLAKNNIERAEKRWRGYLRHTVTKQDGIRIRSFFRPVGSVGCYCPGGKAVYPSSVLMNVLPAKLAGVERIALCTPPSGGNGDVNPLLLVAAHLCGIDEIYRVGGVQAIAALAYGTKTIPRVDKIVGPGNAYVMGAKLLVSNRVAVDMPAGPSELIVIADETADVNNISRDLISQAEHGEDSVCGLLTTSRDLGRAVAQTIDRLLRTVERRRLIENSLSKNGFVLYALHLERLIAFANAFAPEHLEVMTANAASLAEGITSAGLTLIGNFSPVAASDYVLGTNHVLPTGGFARACSGLSVFDFLKRMSIVECNEQGLRRSVGPIRALALAEGLPNHFLAVAERFSQKPNRSLKS